MKKCFISVCLHINSEYKYQSLIIQSFKRNNYNLTLTLSVFDVYDANTEVMKIIKVTPIFNKATQLIAINNLLSTITTGETSIDESKQVINTITTIINSVNCKCSGQYAFSIPRLGLHIHSDLRLD